MAVEHGADFVRVALMKSTEGDAIVALMRRSGHPVTITDRGAYWMLEAPDEIAVDVEELSDEVGEDVSVEDILVTFTSYAGRAEVDGDIVRVTSRFLQLDDAEPGATGS